MQTWKTVCLRAAGFGAGFAVAATLIFGVVIWWSDRPVKPKPWDAQSITSNFTGASTYGGESPSLEFEYGLTNNTDTDYRLPEKIVVMSRNGTDTLSEVSAPWTQVNVFVPAHKTIDYRLVVLYKDLFRDHDVADPDTSKEMVYLNGHTKDLKGFVIFDEANRYEIDFKSGVYKQSK